MDGILPGTSHRPQTVLQRFLTDRAPERRSLYWRDSHADAGRRPSVHGESGGILAVDAGGTLSFDTYFNAFFEAQWHRYTRLRRVMLQITLSGSALVRVYRHALGTKALVVEQTAGPGTAWIALPTPGTNFRQHGFLSVELDALHDSFAFLGGAWVTQDTPAVEVGLAAVFCTFNRELDITRVMGALGSDCEAQERIARVFVISQGRPGLALSPAFLEATAPLGLRLTVIEQENFGGAGGFSRGLLAALADPALTHAVLLDDDIDLEPDSLLRMAAFFSFCDRDLVLGGHMLDLLYPTTLYEAGAVVSHRHWNFLPQHFGRELANTSELEPLSHPFAVHYNGWWCCGIPLSILREHGMPLPCFIRGDDLEFGLRLHQRGVPTVPMPGVAVWHEPFYLKLGGWHIYYETRNMLVTASLHQPFDRSGVVRRMGRQITVHLLTYRYYGTALILQGIRDFLAGPAIMRDLPLPRHAGLSAHRAQHPPLSMPREEVSHEHLLPSIPKGAVRCLAVLAWLLVRNALMPTCRTAPKLLPSSELHWLIVRNTGQVATETWWDNDLPVFRRDRDQHRILLRDAATLIVRLFREGPRASAAWREAAPELTSIGFWQSYLGVPSDAVQTASNKAQQPASMTTAAA